MPMKRLLVLLAAAVLAACSPKPVAFNATDITGGSFDPSFELTDHTGARRTLEDFRGKVVTVFFGFTQCPDVCPGTLIEMKEVMALLGEDADRVQTLFITVDPERDTPEVLAAYVPAFDPRFLGLYGEPDEIARVARGYRVFYEKVPGSSPENYQINHTAASYVIDPQGELRLFVKHGSGAEALAHDIRLLLEQAPGS
jgi:protein SCO1/2